MSYLDLDGIRSAFANHLIKHRRYSKAEAAMVVSDFPDSYTNCYLMEKYDSECEIDGKKYEKRINYTIFDRVGIKAPTFYFYTFYRSEDVADHKVGSYMKARKLYQVENLDMDDFPKLK